MNEYDSNRLSDLVKKVGYQRTKDLEKVSDYLIDVPAAHPKIFPILASVSLQLLAYHLAVLRGCDVDSLEILPRALPWNNFNFLG